MRTTVTLDEDTAAAVEQLRRERGVGISAAVNELVRRAVTRQERARPFVQRTSVGHAKIDVTDVCEALEILDGSAAS
ncbi:MAG: CopG family transcriptional regulator [Pseudonocardiaceae bacterium]